MKHLYLALILCLPFTVTAQEQQEELKATEPAIWLRGDRGTAKTSLWEDQTDSKNNATATALETPEKGNFLNFNPVLKFDGIDDYLEIPYSLERLSGFTLVTVFHATDTIECGVWGVENGPARKSLLTTRHVQGPDSTLNEYGRHEQRAVVNAITQNWSEKSEGTTDAVLALGSAGKEREHKPFKGTIAEFMLFDEPLNFLERTKAQTYLAIKYGIPLKEGNYVSSAGAVLWRTEDNKAHSHNMAGIGRDDSFSLYQKQAQSAYDTADLLTISVGKKAKANAENKSAINNADFLVWGDNGLSFDLHHVEGEDTLLSVAERKWLIKASGYTSKNLKTELRFDLSVLPFDSLGYWLAIDRTGSGDFSIDNLEFIEPDSITTDSIAFYSDIQWDTDGSGGDMFGFAQKAYMLPVLTEIIHPDCFETSGGSIKIKVLGGTPKFDYALAHTSEDLSRTWHGVDSARQKTLTSGKYTLAVEDADGYLVERTFELAIADALVVDLGKDQKIREGEEITLDASIQIPDSVPVSYSWEGNFGFRSTDSVVTVNESGIYTATVTRDEDGCPFSDQIVLSGSPVKRFAVLPNVMERGKVRINLSLQEAGEVEVRIVNGSGSEHSKMRGNGRSEYQFIQEMRDPGIYVVIVETGGEIDTKKLIVY